MVITVTNTGTGVLTGGLSLSGIDYPWLTASTNSAQALQPATTADLDVGQSVTFTLQVVDAGQELGDYYDLILIDSPNDSRLGAQPFYLKVYVHPPLVTFTVPVTNTLGEPVPGARVAFTKAVTRRVLVDGQPGPGRLSPYFKGTGTADGSGLARLPQTEVGPYRYTISADGHRTLTGTANIPADVRNGRFVPPPLLALPGLVFEPSQKTVSAVAGQATALSFRISNQGPADAHNFRVQTPHGPA
jgi:hypothetical protein